jgi:hypothetical protein
MEFPKIGATARDDLFFAKLANDCLLQAQEHLAHAIENRKQANKNYLDLSDADMKIEEASRIVTIFAEATLEEEPEAR